MAPGAEGYVVRAYVDLPVVIGSVVRDTVQNVIQQKLTLFVPLRNTHQNALYA